MFSPLTLPSLFTLPICPTSVPSLSFRPLFALIPSFFFFISVSFSPSLSSAPLSPPVIPSPAPSLVFSSHFTIFLSSSPLPSLSFSEHSHVRSAKKNAKTDVRQCLIRKPSPPTTLNGRWSGADNPGAFMKRTSRQKLSSAARVNGGWDVLTVWRLLSTLRWKAPATRISVPRHGVHRVWIPVTDPPPPPLSVRPRCYHGGFR